VYIDTAETEALLVMSFAGKGHQQQELWSVSPFLALSKGLQPNHTAAVSCRSTNKSNSNHRTTIGEMVKVVPFVQDSHPFRAAPACCEAGFICS